MTGQPALRRRLTLVDAVTIGLGSMIGAGVFSALSPAAALAGPCLLAGLLIAGVVAFCNATSSAQLATQYPSSGGTYLYGRERLGQWPGFLAGWSFVIGKTASCAAMAMTFAAYAAPPGDRRPAAVAAVLVLTAVNMLGVTRTAALTRVLVAVSLVALVVVVAIGLTHDPGTGVRTVVYLGDDPTTASDHWWHTNEPGIVVTQFFHVTPYGILQAAGFLFFAFAGYARIATMGEEVVDPRRTIPRAITTALVGALAIYLLVALAALHALGPMGLASSPRPLFDTVATAGLDWPQTLVRVGAMSAALGALLAMIAGIGRTSLAMARNADLPTPLAAVHPRFRTPYRAELLLGLVVAVLVATTNLATAIGFSSFGVLLYYLVANLSALTQTGPDRRYPKALQVLGAVGCVVLVATLPVASIVSGLGVLAVGALARLAFLKMA